MSWSRPLIWGVCAHGFVPGGGSSPPLPHPASPTRSPLPPAGVGLNPELAKLKGKLANF